MHHPLDHRELNRDLDVFATDALAGAGLPLWLPDGADHPGGAAGPRQGDRPRRRLPERLHPRPRQTRRSSSDRATSPSSATDMFPPMAVGGDELVLRPANCPHHRSPTRSRRHSYRELPIRFNELGAMFRAERSGVLSGLSRVRQISLDDTHVFCRPDQVDDEVARALRSALRAQQILGLPVDYVRLSGGDGPDYLGSVDEWVATEEALRRTAASVLDGGLELVEATGAGGLLRAQARSPGARRARARGDDRHRAGRLRPAAALRPHVRRRRRLEAARRDGAPRHGGRDGHVVAALLEHYQGRLPVWWRRSGRRPARQRRSGRSARIADDLLAAGLRPGLDVDGSLGARVRASRERREPVIAIIGVKEAAAGTVQTRHRGRARTGGDPPDRVVSAVRAAHAGRCAAVWPAEHGHVPS